ncbi:MAG: glycosyltransferase family 4 protein [Sciscionella sp.]
MPELVVLAEQLLAAVPGGTGRYTGQLAAALARTAPQGWTVTGVVARHRDIEAARIDGVAGPRVLPLPSRALITAWDRGLPLWPGGDSVHAPTPLAPPRLPRGRGLVVTVHDTVPWTHPETLTARGASWHRRVIGRATRRADAVVVPTAAVAAQLRGYLPGAAPVEVIGHGVSSTVTAPVADSEGIAERLALPDRYVLAVGTVEPRKGLDVLIEAMSMAAGPEVPLVVAGPEGWGGVRLEEIASRHGLPRARLRVLGRLTDRQLAVTLRRASVLAVPSLAEGFGLPLLEGMATGVPVVHSDAQTLVEVAGGSGLVVPRGDAAALALALRSVLAEPAATGSRVAAGKVRAALFTWDAAAVATWDVHVRCYLRRQFPHSG